MLITTQLCRKLFLRLLTQISSQFAFSFGIDKEFPQAENATLITTCTKLDTNNSVETTVYPAGK